MLINVIWSLIYFYGNVLQEYSLWIVNSMNIYLLFNSDIRNFVLKTNGVREGGMGVGVQKALFCYFCFLRCSNCWWVKCGGVGRKSYLGQTKITCFCLFRDVRVSSRFPCVTAEVGRFSLDLCRAVKKCIIIYLFQFGFTRIVHKIINYNMTN